MFPRREGGKGVRIGKKESKVSKNSSTGKQKRG